MGRAVTKLVRVSMATYRRIDLIRAKMQADDPAGRKVSRTAAVGAALDWAFGYRRLGADVAAGKAILISTDVYKERIQEAVAKTTDEVALVVAEAMAGAWYDTLREVLAGHERLPERVPFHEGGRRVVFTGWNGPLMRFRVAVPGDDPRAPESCVEVAVNPFARQVMEADVRELSEANGADLANLLESVYQKRRLDAGTTVPDDVADENTEWSA